MNEIGSDSAPAASLSRKQAASVSSRFYGLEAQLRSLTAAITILGALIAVWSYLIDRFWRVAEPTIEYPSVVELRCSRTDYDSGPCNDPSEKHYAHLSLTGAFPISVRGAAMHKIELEKADATGEMFAVDQSGRSQDEQEPSPPWTLHAFWTADLTGEDKDNRKQIVSRSVAGGESISREIWFMPLPRACGEVFGKPECDLLDRRDFVSWGQFFRDARSIAEDHGRSSDEKVVTVRFQFHWEGGRCVQRTCRLELGPSFLHQSKPAREPLYFTFPCVKMEEGDGSCSEVGD